MAKKPAKAKPPKGGGKSDQVKNLRAARANKGQAAKDTAKKVERATKGTKAVGAPRARPAEARRVPSAGELKSLVNVIRKPMNDAASLQATVRQKIGDAAEKINLNAPAFQQVRRMIKMGETDPVRLRTYLDDLHDYMEKLEVEKLAGDSLFDERREEGDADDESGADDHNPSPGESTGEDGQGDLPGNVTRLGGQPAAA